MFVMMACVVVAAPTYEICEDTREIYANCTMVTPTLNCNVYNYNITNVSNGGHVSEELSLTLLNDSMYYFNFTQPKGDYIVTLCDGSTREVRVKGDTEMEYLLIAFILFGTIILMWTFAIILPKQHMMFKALLAIIAFVLIFPFIGFGFTVVNTLGLPEQVKSVVFTFYRAFGGLLTIASAYGFIRFVIYLVEQWRSVLKEKQDKKDYDPEWGEFW